MHIQTHILSGWCIANALPCTARQRLLAMTAASAADVDGISYVFGQEAFWKFHHTFGHNVFAAVIISAGFAAFVPHHRSATFLLCVTLYHLHLLMDYFGSGSNWDIHYLWPRHEWILRNRNAWEFYSWQNMLIFFSFLLWTLWIAWRKKRTPLECIMPTLDAQLVGITRAG